MPAWFGEALLSAVISTGVLSVVLPILLRFVFQSRLESFKTTLAKDLENHKADLNAAILERTTRFSALHERRAAAIAEIYKQLLVTRTRFGGFVAPFQIGKEHQNKLCSESVEATNHLIHDCVRPNLIYFEALFAERLNTCCNRIFELVHGSVIDYDMAKQQGENPYFKEGSDFATAAKQVQEQIDPMLSELADEFRALLSSANTGSPPEPKGE